MRKIIMITVAALLAACGGNAAAEFEAPPAHSGGKIFLYGETHADSDILDKELEIWGEHYAAGMRHLFIEQAYYSAEFLNVWLKAENDEIYNGLAEDWSGTSAASPACRLFFAAIKERYPETIFHGTDVGHQYDSTGKRFLKYLDDRGEKGSERYVAAQANIAQGKRYYRANDDTYREKCMVQNFIREFDGLDGESVMGIYGSAHTGIESGAYGSDTPCMANQLYAVYGSALNSLNLADKLWLKEKAEPLKTTVFTINGKDYDASNFGVQDLSAWSDDYTSREFWRLENAYGDFKEFPKTGEVLPYNNYPMLITEGQVFVIDYTKPDGSKERQYLRSDGYVWDGRPSTERLLINE